MNKLNLTVDLNNLTEEEREKFFKLVEKSKKEPFNPFEKVGEGERYYAIGGDCAVDYFYEYNDEADKDRFERVNYYNNKEFAEHQALRELLNRKLMKFSYENGGSDIDNYIDAYSIYNDSNHILCISDCCPDLLSPMFISEEIAQRAIDEIVKPFLEEHPDFKWWG